MKVAFNGNLEQDTDTVPDNWADFWMQMLALVYRKTPQLKTSASDSLCASRHFLSQKVNAVEWYDKKGDRHTFTNYHEIPPRNEVGRVVAKIKHIELEYVLSGEDGAGYVTSSGHQYDVNSPDFTEANEAMMEKALSAMSLAYMARSNGWDEVNFDQTDDPIDRYMMMMACKRVGISYGSEGIYSSSVSGVKVKGDEEYLSSPYVQAAIAEIEKKGDDPNKTDLVATAAQIAFNSYIKTQPPVFPKVNQGQSASQPVSNSAPQQSQPLVTNHVSTHDVLGYDF